MDWRSFQTNYVSLEKPSGLRINIKLKWSVRSMLNDELRIGMMVPIDHNFQQGHERKSQKLFLAMLKNLLRR